MRERQRLPPPQPVPPSSSEEAAQPLTSEEARQQAQAEGLTLRVADNKAGYYGVHQTANKPRRDNQALRGAAVARWPEGGAGLHHHSILHIVNLTA